MNATAAVEFALGMVARAFLLAEPVPAVPALTPLTLSMLARQTISLGNAVFEIGRGLQLRPVAQYSIAGGPAPESWRYSFKQQRPNGEDPLDIDSLPTRNVSYEGMVHVRYMPSPAAPWAGISPFQRAGMTADLMANIEQMSLKYDAQVPTGGLIPVPDGASPRECHPAQRPRSRLARAS